MKPVHAFVAVGSNIDPAENIPEALGLLREYCPILNVSSVYITAPIGPKAQPEFRNGMLLVEWNGTPRALKFDILKKIEDSLGRLRSSDKYLPRTIDLDIALFGDQIVKDRDLTIPDPDIRTRAYLAKALLEIAPVICLPDTGEFVRELTIVRDAHVFRVDEALTRTVKEKLHGR